MTLKWNVELHQQNVSRDKFFQDLSNKDGIFYGHGFGRRFHIERNPTALDGNTFKIQEEVRLLRFHPLRIFMKAAPGKQRVSDTANLVALIKKDPEEIVKLSNINIKRVTAVFDRLAESMTRNVSNSDAKKIRNNFKEASKLLRNAAIEHDIDVNGTTWRSGKEVRVGAFVRKLGSTWPWPFRFNQRFHVVESNKGAAFSVHLESKPWFFQKLIRMPEEFTTWKFWQDMRPLPASGSSKVATAEMLAKMFTHEKELLRELQPNIGQMISNLEKTKERIVRNTNPQEKARIETAFNTALRELKKLGHLVRKDVHNSWPRRVWKYTAVPLMRGSRAVTGSAKAAISSSARFLWNLRK